MITHSFLFRVVAALALALPCAAFASSKALNTTTFSHLAVHGYDAVAYFTEHKAVEGEKQFSLEKDGATWRFASQANLDTFKADPAKYAPQFGGYCAYAVSQGKTADIDPQAWKIVNGKLYLNYSKKIQEKWEQDQARYIVDADKNWPQLSENK